MRRCLCGCLVSEGDRCHGCGATMPEKERPKVIEITLPLPPSKNDRTTMVTNKSGQKIILVKREVRKYRDDVALLIRSKAGQLPDKQKIIVACVWYRDDPRADVHNYHAELCDAIAPALGLNDRYFLVRDMDVIDVQKGDGKVWIQMQPTGDVLKP